jgi:hypothetical protein
MHLMLTFLYIFAAASLLFFFFLPCGAFGADTKEHSKERLKIMNIMPCIVTSFRRRFDVDVFLTFLMIMVVY